LWFRKRKRKKKKKKKEKKHVLEACMATASNRDKKKRSHGPQIVRWFHWKCRYALSP
jgi:hypothetical protein